MKAADKMTDKDRPRRVAVVLFNLGGPDGPDSVQPFLYNLFADKAIIGAPFGIRQGLAWLISTLRKKSAQANYAIMGGGSPLLPQTVAQAQALEAALNLGAKDQTSKVFIAMRYWKPCAKQTAKQVDCAALAVKLAGVRRSTDDHPRAVASPH